jgi:WHG domain-containing protein
MDGFLEVLADQPPGPPPPARLAAQLRAWHARSGGAALPPAVLHRGIVCWSRLHGLLMLELDGHVGSMGLDPALLYRAEVDALAG